MSKSILITGATSGFGYMASEQLIQAGHRVYVGARDIAGRNRESATKLQAMGGTPIELDVTKQGDIDAAFESIESLDVLINNAGVAQMGPAEAYTEDQVRRIFEVNVLGVFAVSRAALPLLRRSEDALILYTSSLLGRICLPGLTPYVASKWAVDGLAESWSYELRAMGIDTAIIQPGAMGTDIFQKMIPPKDETRLQHYAHMETMGQAMMGSITSLMQGDDANDPQDVARAFVDLINMPKGRRPLRTAVGQDSVVVNALNEQGLASQDETMAFYGLESFKAPRPVDIGT